MIYLDNSATTRPSAGVVAAIGRALSEGWYNPSSMYAPSVGVEKQMNECRERIKGAIHGGDAQVIFTSGGTEANNLAINGTVGVARGAVRVAVSDFEHPSVLATADLLTKQGCEVIHLNLDERGQIDYEQLEKELKQGLTLVSCMQVNNEVGAKQDIKRLSDTVRRLCPGCRLHVDGVQGFLREDIDFRLIDMYTCSSHKIHGPKGVGALVVKKGLRLKAAHTGGSQENAIRSGTENTPGILGFSEAIAELTALEGRRERLMALKLKLAAALKAAVPEVMFAGPLPDEGACHILNGIFPGVRGETLLHALEEKGVLVSTGSACSAKSRAVSHTLTALHIPAQMAECALRFSLCPYNTEEEIAFAAAAVGECYDILKQFRRR